MAQCLHVVQCVLCVYKWCGVSSVFTCGVSSRRPGRPALSRPTNTISVSHSCIMVLTQYHSRRMHSRTLFCSGREGGSPSTKPLLTQSQLTPQSLSTPSPSSLWSPPFLSPSVLGSPHRHLHHRPPPSSPRRRLHHRPPLVPSIVTSIIPSFSPLPPC